MDHGVKVASVLADSYATQATHLSIDQTSSMEKAIQLAISLGKNLSFNLHDIWIGPHHPCNRNLFSKFRRLMDLNCLRIVYIFWTLALLFSPPSIQNHGCALVPTRLKKLWV